MPRTILDQIREQKKPISGKTGEIQIQSIVSIVVMPIP